MHANPAPVPDVPTKALTGITGFDDLTGGGLPRGRTTLLVGGPGSGKTIFGLQFLADGANNGAEPGIFVAFEESSGRLLANAESFGWKLGELQRDGKLFFLDAQPELDLIQSGDFDLGGLLAGLEVQVRRMGARRIVFDALDIILTLLPDPIARKREIHRLHHWLLGNDLTGLITAKASPDGGQSLEQEPFAFMQFMFDCAIVLNHCVRSGVSQRNLRVQKYRGSGFDENESPFLINLGGIELAIARHKGLANALVTSERVSSGVERLDTMLDGGYYRGANVLITGFPGTAKTSLSGAFAQAACERGERTVFICFDSDGAEMIRNLASVGILLQAYVDNGCLRVISARSISGSAEAFMAGIKEATEAHGARCLVIDALSAVSKAGNELTAHSVAERLVDWSKARGITLVCTSLLNELSGPSEVDSSQLQFAPLADTWIHLSYRVQAGERNRGCPSSSRAARRTPTRSAN